MAIMMVAISKFIGPMTTVLQRFRVRHEMTSESRSCLNVMSRLLANAKKESLAVDVPPGATGSVPPNSWLSFDVTDAAGNTVNYQFYWSSSPMNTVLMR